MNAPNFAAKADDFATGIDSVGPSAPEERHGAWCKQALDAMNVLHMSSSSARFPWPPPWEPSASGLGERARSRRRRDSTHPLA
jgi:hypothetical protein